MASVYPGALDALSNPTPSDSLATVPHSTQHGNINDAMEAVQGELGINPAGLFTTVVERLDVTAAQIRGESQIAGATSPAISLLSEATFWIDAQYAADSQTVPNLGTGGSVLNAMAGSTVSVDGNDPKFLDYTGTPYVYLPGVAGNTLACTAPATAASYAAYPVGGGAATTGAVTGGAAFTFSTVGSWLRVDLLTAGSVVVASFNGTALTTGAAVGQTDAYAVAWTINRSAAGRKSAAVVAPCWLFGTDDFMEVPSHDLLNFGAADSFTVLAVVRQWATVSAQGLVAKAAGLAVANVGYALYSDVMLHRFIMQDGSFQPFANQNLTYGALQSVAGVRNTTTDTVGLSISGAALTTGSDSTTGTLANAQTLRIGSIGGANLGNFEGVAFAVFRRALTAAEITTLSDYYATRAPLSLLVTRAGAETLTNKTIASPRVTATTQTTVGAAGGASALPATPTGYIPVTINGTAYVLPYYAKA